MKQRINEGLNIDEWGFSSSLDEWPDLQMHIKLEEEIFIIGREILHPYLNQTDDEVVIQLEDWIWLENEMDLRMQEEEQKRTELKNALNAVNAMTK